MANETYGVNLNLTGVDNLSKVVEKAMDTSTTVISMGALQMGAKLTDLGGKLVGFVTSYYQHVFQTGQAVETLTRQMDNVFGSSSRAKEVMAQVKDVAGYFGDSVSDIASAVMVFQRMGLDAFSKVSSGGKAMAQDLMTYAKDLGDFMPDVTNRYGSGTKAAAGAIAEYVGGGRSLALMPFGISAGALGKKGKTADERQKQVIDYLNKSGISGFYGRNADNPSMPMMLSSISAFVKDVWSGLAQGKVWEQMQVSTRRIYDTMREWRKDLPRLQQALDEAFALPIQMADTFLQVALKAATVVKDFAKSSPTLTKMAIGVLTIGGGIVFLIGKTLTWTGMLAQSAVAIKYANENLLKGKTLMQAFSGGLSGLRGKMGWITLALIAWQTNFLGVREASEKTFEFLLNTLRLVFASLDGYMTSEEYDLAEKMGIVALLSGLQLLKMTIIDVANSLAQSMNEMFGTSIKPMNSLADVIATLIRGFGELLYEIMLFIRSDTGKVVLDLVKNFVWLSSLLFIVSTGLFFVGGKLIWLCGWFDALALKALWFQKLTTFLTVKLPLIWDSLRFIFLIFKGGGAVKFVSALGAAFRVVLSVIVGSSAQADKLIKKMKGIAIQGAAIAAMMLVDTLDISPGMKLVMDLGIQIAVWLASVGNYPAALAVLVGVGVVWAVNALNQGTKDVATQNRMSNDAMVADGTMTQEEADRANAAGEAGKSIFTAQADEVTARFRERNLKEIQDRESSIRVLQSKGGGTMNVGGVNITVNGNVDPAKIAKMTRDELEKFAREQQLKTYGGRNTVDGQLTDLQQYANANFAR